MTPKSIKKSGPNELKVIWLNGHESVYTFEDLRDFCPCATCSGETLLLHEYRPAEPDRTTPGRYDLTKIELVGSYAIQLHWGDGHGTGIYTWNLLLRKCKCPEHSPAGMH
jgi:DUF971 family protein